MEQFLQFWPKRSVLTYLSGAPQNEFIFTRSFSTAGFTEVVIQFECDAKILHSAFSEIHVVPQMSNDGQNWEDDLNLMGISQGSSYPTKEVKKYTQIGALMRIKIVLQEGLGGSAGVVAGTIMVTGVGRSDN